MREETEHASDKVIYQYKLLKKIRPHPAVWILHWIGILLWGIGVTLRGFEHVWLWIIGSAAGWQIVYFLVTIIVLTRDASHLSELRRYRWVIRWNQWGYLPTSNVSFLRFRGLIFHSCFIGITVSCLLAPWVPLEAALTIAFVHLWSIGRRLALVVLLRRHALPNAVLHFGPDGIHLYAP